jgi:SanA protein
MLLWILVPLATALLLVALANVAVLRAGGERMRATIAELAPAPVAIVLGAAVRPDGTPSHALEDRLAQAVELYRAGKVGKLLLSGDHGQERYDETNGMRKWVLEQGVAPEDVFCDHAGFSTFDTMARARSVFGITRAIVVTQRFHLARSLYTAREAGIEAQGTPCDRRTYRKGPWFELRELGSRTKACAQASGLWPSTALAGTPIPIEGDGRASWDEPR